MATGNKTVRSRQNARSRAANRPERRGGKRPGAGQPKKRRSSKKPPAKTKVAIPGLRAELLDLLEAQAKKNKQHRLQVFADILHDKKWEKFRSTNAGGKVVSQLVDVIFNEPSAGQHPWTPPTPQPPEADGAGSPKSGADGLPPLKPDPAKVASFNKGEQRCRRRRA